MRSKSLMVRTCAIVISLIQLAIFVSLASPAFGSQGKNFWQALFPSSWAMLSHDLPSTVAFAFILFGTLALPPLASWTASRSPERMMSLLGMWLSLPCTFIPFLLGIELNELFTQPVSLVLPAGFGLSFMLCLVLALRLPLIRAHEQATLLVSRSEGLASIQDESSEEGEEARSARADKDFRLPIFAFLGLLCHLLIFLSLFLTYIDYYNPYGEAVLPTPTTGWQLLGEAFKPHAFPRAALLPPPCAPLASVLLVALILPALVYLVCLVFLPVSSKRKNTRLRASISLSYLLTIISLSLSSFCLAFSLISHGGDLSDPYLNTDVAFAIPPVAFLLSLICCRVLMVHFLRHTEKKLS